MSLVDAIKDIQYTISSIPGIRSAPDDPPEDATAYPFVVAYAGSGEFRTGEPAGQMLYLGSIIVDLHVARKDLPRDAEKAMTYHESIPNDILEDTTLGGTISTCGPVSCSGLIAMSYGGQDTLGLRFTVQNVKIQAAFS
jgi:hypothetical protein